MRTFKEYVVAQELNERFLGDIKNQWTDREIAMYINPSVGDLSDILKLASGKRIRGFNIGPNVYVWNNEQGYHLDAMNALKNTYPDDKDYQDQPDVCFYLDMVQQTPNVMFKLKYSQFTGSSTSEGNSRDPLRRLVQLPAMKRLKDCIYDYDEVVNPKSTKCGHCGYDYSNNPSAKYCQRCGNSIHKPDTRSDVSTYAPSKEGPVKLNIPSNVNPKKNPYKWASGLHRVGD